MLFLLNDAVLEFDLRALAPPVEADRFRALSFSDVLSLGQELFAEEPLLHRVAPERARRLAALIQLKQPDINAALFVAPHRRCDPAQVACRFVNLGFELIAGLHGRSDNGALDPVVADQAVWRRLAA